MQWYLAVEVTEGRLRVSQPAITTSVKHVRPGDDSKAWGGSMDVREVVNRADSGGQITVKLVVQLAGSRGRLPQVKLPMQRIAVTERRDHRKRVRVQREVVELRPIKQWLRVRANLHWAVDAPNGRVVVLADVVEIVELAQLRGRQAIRQQDKPILREEASNLLALARQESRGWRQQLLLLLVC